MARTTPLTGAGTPGTATGRRSRRRSVARTAALLVVPAMLVAACSGGDDDGGEAGGGSNELNILVVKHPLTKAMDDMAWVQQLEEEAGVTITWEEVSADWDQKKSTILAAGDVPDLVIGPNVITDSDLATYSSLFTDLSEHLDELPNVSDMFAQVDGAEAMATQADGSVYALPRWKNFWPQAITRQYINQQWLDNLGLEMPTTMDELYDVLLAFKTEDANGNGDPDDEIPFDWAPVTTTGWGYFQPSALLGSTGLPISAGGGTGYFVEDGQVGYWLGDERWKSVLEFLEKANAAGLISSNVMTQDYSAYQSVGRGSGDDAAVGMSWGWTASDRFGAQLAPQYASMGPVPMEEGQSADVTWSYDFENLTPNNVLLSAQSDAQAAGLRVINALYGEDMSIETLFGDIPEYVTKDEATGAYEVLPPADGTSDPSTWKWTNTLADNSPGWIRADTEMVLPSDLAEAVEQSAPLEDAIANVDPDSDVWPPYIKMSAEDLSTIALNNTTMLNLTQTKFAQWVTNGGVDAEWDDYVSQLQSAGMDANIEIYQRYYDESQG